MKTHMHGVAAEIFASVAQLEQHGVRDGLPREAGARRAEGHRHAVLGGNGQDAGDVLLTVHLRHKAFTAWGTAYNTGEMCSCSYLAGTHMDLPMYTLVGNQLTTSFVKCDLCFEPSLRAYGLYNVGQQTSKVLTPHERSEGTSDSL